jgi:DNA-binding SARP family transcriptional activator/TolB-like protein
MLRLRMLGGLDLEGDTSLTSVQRRPLALLALIAMAGARGIAREKVAAYLWPESDAEHARNALNQTLHQLRRGDLREVVSGTTELKLEPDILTSDVTDFENAIATGDFIRAVELHRGPFLDGVHVRGAPLFERWVDEHRQKLDARCAVALEALARRADADRDVDGAIRWWRKLVELNPLSSRATIGLMRALAANGDETTALQQARIHERLVRDELDALPAPEIRALAESLRAESQKAPDTSLGAEPTRSNVATTPLVAPTIALSPHSSADRRFNRRSVVMASVTLAIVSLSLGLVAVRGPSSADDQMDRTTELDSERVVVGSFENLTGDSTLDIVGPMAADWVTQGLARSGVIMVVGHSFEPWSRPTRAVRRDDVWRALGRSTGSRIVLHGSYVLSGDTLRLQAMLSDAMSGRVIQAIDPVSGPRRDPLAVADRLRQRATSVMAARLNPELQHWIATAGQPTNFDAYREYAEGMADFADGRWKESQIHFFRSAVEDTSYTLPLLWASFALGNDDKRERRDSLVRSLTSRRANMAPLDRALHDYLQTLKPNWEERLPANRQARYQAASRLVQLAPGSEFQWKLGNAAWDVGRPHEAMRLFARVDPGQGWVRSLGYLPTIVELYELLGDHAAARDVLRRHAQDMDNGDRLHWQAMIAAELGEATQVQQLVSEMATQTPSTRALSSVQGIVWDAARALRRSGCVADATRLAEWGLAFLDTSSVAREAAKEPSAAVYQNFRRAAMLSDLGRLPESQAVFEMIESVLARHDAVARRTLASAEDLEVGVLGYLADIALRRGDRAAANGYRNRILAFQPPANGADQYVLARIAALDGRREEAVALLSPIAWDWIYHLRLDPDLDTLRNYPPFRALLKPPAA